MSDTINIILEYLRRHHFSKAEAVLREEVTSRGSNGLLPLQLDDDELDLDVSLHLQSVVQEKAAGLGQQTVLKFTHDKVGPDTEKYVPMELKQGSQGWLGSEKKEKLHLLNADKLQPPLKVEEPGILFTNFKVEEQEQPVSSMSSIGSTSPLVIFPPVSVKQLSEQLFSPVCKKGGTCEEEDVIVSICCFIHSCTFLFVVRETLTSKVSNCCLSDVNLM